MSNIIKRLQRRRSIKGFTIIECIVAMAVISVISIMTISFIQMSNQASPKVEQEDAKTLADNALTSFQFADNKEDFERVFNQVSQNQLTPNAKVCTVCENLANLSAAHHHTIHKISANSPTCIDAGNIEYYYCPACDTCFSNSGGTAIISKSSTVVSALGHSYNGGYCYSSEGHWQVCQRCGLAGDIVGHDFWDVSNIVCDVCEYFAESVHQHDLELVLAVEATCTEFGYDSYYRCNICNILFEDENATVDTTLYTKRIEPLTHDYVDGFCSRCGAAQKKTSIAENYDLYAAENGGGMARGIGCAIERKYTMLDASNADMVGAYTARNVFVDGGKNLEMTYLSVREFSNDPSKSLQNITSSDDVPYLAYKLNGGAGDIIKSIACEIFATMYKSSTTKSGSIELGIYLMTDVPQNGGKIDFSNLEPYMYICENEYAAHTNDNPYELAVNGSDMINNNGEIYIVVAFSATGNVVGTTTASDRLSGYKTNECIRFYGIDFSAELTHSHELTNVPKVNSMCNSKGCNEFWYCKGCNTYFSDENCSHEVDKDSLVLNKQGHSPLSVPERAATCISEGSTGYAVCTRCHNALVLDEYLSNGNTIIVPASECIMPKIDHEIKSIDNITATCQRSGRTVGEYCIICGLYTKESEITPKIAHSASALKSDLVYHWTECNNCHLRVSGAKHTVASTTSSKYAQHVYTIDTGNYTVNVTVCFGTGKFNATVNKNDTSKTEIYSLEYAKE